MTGKTTQEDAAGAKRTVQGVRSSGRLPLWACVLFAAAVLLVQARFASTIRSSEPTYSDEPAHYTTSVMVFEYLRTALGKNPMPFARSFYIRYPKVGLGHWPPGFYAVEALVFFLTGPSQVAAKASCGTIAFGIAGLLAWRVKKWRGWADGLLAGAVFLAIGMVQVNAWQIMSDLLTGLFVLLAVLAFSDFLAALDGKSALRFTMWSVLAILTKGSGWALGIFALLAPLLTAQWKCFRSWRYWISGFAILAIGAPFYWLTREKGIAYQVDVVNLVVHAHPGGNALRFAMTFFTPVLLGVAVAGLGGVLFQRWVRGVESAEVRDGLCAAAGVLAQLIFLLLFPLTEEGRYLLASAALTTLLFVQGAYVIRDGVRRFSVRWAAFAPVLLAIGVLAESRFPKPPLVTGFRASATSIPFRPQGSVILVSSDALGEGDWIADRLEADKWRAGVVLRASSVLASSTWSGLQYQLRFQDSAGVLGYLHSTAVRYVVIDRSAKITPHQYLLDEAVHQAPGEFRLLGSFPVDREPGSQRGNVDVYASTIVDRNPPEIRLPGRGSDWGSYRMQP